MVEKDRTAVVKAADDCIDPAVNGILLLAAVEVRFLWSNLLLAPWEKAAFHMTDLFLFFG